MNSEEIFENNQELKANCEYAERYYELLNRIDNVSELGVFTTKVYRCNCPDLKHIWSTVTMLNGEYVCYFCHDNKNKRALFHYVKK